ncbi:MAG: hypothetical protein WB698_01695 [Solirubrobacteraceae bacterium]
MVLDLLGRWGPGYLGLLVLLLASLLVAGCGGSGTTTSTSLTSTASAQPSASELQAQAKQHKQEAAERKRQELAARRKEAEERRREAVGKRREETARRAEAHLGHGLGATEATFNANNTIGHGPDPPLGVAWMHVMYKIGSRVAAFNINANFTPAISAHELIFLMSIHNLPEDAELVTEHESCVVWRSPTLGRLLGNEYAEGFVEESDNKYAELITTSKPECE